MRILNVIISKYILCTLVSFLILTLLSCEDDNVGDFVLTGNIEHLIPDGSYNLKKTTTSDGQYVIFTPNLNSNFEYWGLTLKQVEYYIDDVLYKTETVLPCELMINKNNMEIGNHKLIAQMTIVGEACNDVILKKEDVFYISSIGEISNRHGDFYINYNHVMKGDELIITPELLVNRSTDGCKIDEVKYYWDGSLISTVTSSPFELKYKVDAEEKTEHSIRIVIIYHDNFSSNLTYNWSYGNYTVRTADDYFGFWDIKSGRNDYTNGETVSLVAKLFKGTNVKKTFEIEFYFDDELIGKSSSFPYTLDYKLENLTKGSHIIKGKIITKEGDLTSSQSGEETIIITE